MLSGTHTFKLLKPSHQLLHCRTLPHLAAITQYVFVCMCPWVCMCLCVCMCVLVCVFRLRKYSPGSPCSDIFCVFCVCGSGALAQVCVLCWLGAGPDPSVRGYGLLHPEGQRQMAMIPWVRPPWPQGSCNARCLSHRVSLLFAPSFLSFSLSVYFCHYLTVYFLSLSLFRSLFLSFFSFSYSNSIYVKIGRASCRERV